MESKFSQPPNPKVGIIILNYNGWMDTCECLESVLRSDYPNFQVVVVDNHSSDKSMKELQNWVSGRTKWQPSAEHPLSKLTQPPIEKPVSYVNISIRKSTVETAKPSAGHTQKKLRTRQLLIFIQNDQNFGFAGGNNVGIRYLLQRDDFKYIWLINNDTVVEADALRKLIERMVYFTSKRKKIGILGSKLLYYDNPEILQAAGGRYNKWLGVGSAIGGNEADRGQYDRSLEKLDYIVGAAMLVSREFVEDVGLLAEGYFLYYEELDWAIRARKKGWNLAYCWESRVYHKEGRTIGTHANLQQRSPRSDYYLLKNRLIFARKFYPQTLPLIWASYGYSLLRGLLTGNKARIKTVWQILKEEFG